MRPGHRGIWQEPLRSGKYAINPRCYAAEIVPTFILTLNWAEANSTAHNYDKDLRQIVAKSREGFVVPSTCRSRSTFRTAKRRK